MRETYRFFGWEMSLYSGKLRAYLRHKNIPYEERRATLWDMRQIQETRAYHGFYLSVINQPCAP